MSNESIPEAIQRLTPEQRSQFVRAMTAMLVERYRPALERLAAQ